MQRRAKVALWISALLALACALAWWQRGPLTVALLARHVTALTASADPLAALPDGLHVGLCGAGSPFPDDLRSGPCTAVVAGRRLFIFDAGSSAARNIARMRLNAGQIEALFLTHYHSDHIDGLGELMLQRWIQRTAKAPLPVYGPAGLEQVLQGFKDAYTLDQGYRIAHHGAAVAAAAAQPLPADRAIDGVNLLPFIQGAAPGRPHDVLFWRTDSYRAVRAGDWKLQVSEMPKKDWLFNLATDPTEKTNLAGRQPERVAALKAQLLAWDQTQRKPLWPSLGAGPIAIDHSMKQPTRATDDYVYYGN